MGKSRPRPSWRTFYATEYRREYHGEITPSPRCVLRAWRNGQHILCQVEPQLTPRSRVLEVGAGIGCTVKAFEQQGHAATGIEPNDGFQAYSREQLRADVSKAYLFDLPPQPVNDLVLLVHVIEHFRSPRTVLEHLQKLIRPDGRLYVECPNLGAIATRSNTFHFAHIHNFTPGTLATMARHTGFEVERWFSQPHSPILQVLLRRMEQPNTTIPADGFQQTMAAYHRYSLFSYYLRPTYLAARLSEVLDKSWERLVARSMCVAFWPSGGSRDRCRFPHLVARLREQCRRHGQPANQLAPTPPSALGARAAAPAALQPVQDLHPPRSGARRLFQSQSRQHDDQTAARRWAADARRAADAQPRLADQRDAALSDRLARRSLSLAAASARYGFFTFVRNPYARLVSAWKDKLALSGDDRNARSVRKATALVRRFAVEQNLPGSEPESAIPFATFVSYVESQPEGRRDQHWDTQRSVLLTDLIPFSRVYRMETEFAAGVTEILTRLGLPETWAAERLEHPQNASRKLKEPVFDEQLAERVYQCFAPDFDEFGYDRESWRGL